jgi:hypothetical protein
MKSMNPRPWILGLAGLLFASGVCLWAASETIPAFTDAEAFERGVTAMLNNESYGDSEAYFTLVDHYQTAKWPLLDGGLSLLVWASALLLVALLGLRRMSQASRRVLVVLPLTLLGLFILTMGLLAEPALRVHRWQLPVWADSFAIPQMETLRTMRMLAPIFLVLALAPLLRGKTSPVSLLGPGPGGRWPTWILASLLYAAPVMLLVFVLTAAVEPGGWISTAGALTLIWAMLNARALWLAPKP